MTIVNKREPAILFMGDIILFLVSLWITLFLRYLNIPNKDIFFQHLIPFSILFFVWAVVFYIAGLYEKRTNFMKNILPSRSTTLSKLLRRTSLRNMS